MQNVDSRSYSKTAEYFRSLGGSYSDEEILSILVSALSRDNALFMTAEELTVFGIYRLYRDGSGIKKVGM